MNPWYKPRPNAELPPNVDPHAWAAAIANRSDATLIASLADDLIMAMRAVKQLRVDLEAALAAEQRLLVWQANAFQTVKGWSRVGDLVPGSFRLPGARLSDCTHAYIDHLREENRTLAKELLTMAAPMPTFTFSDGETEWVNP